MFDEAYLRSLKDRNADAEDFLIWHFSRPIRAKLRMRLRSPALVEEASQETFLRIFAYFRAGKTLENPASLPGFVYSMCNNIALELLRADTRHDAMGEHTPEPADLNPDPERQAVAEQRRETVRRLLEELPEKDRQLIRRVFLEEEDKDIVCKDLEVDRDYLRVLLHRARLRFKAALQRSGMSRHAKAAGNEGGVGRTL